MIRRVWENLKPSFEESFIDGLPAAITAKSLRERQFWWIALALGTIVSFYHCYLILESSLGQNTVTKVQLDPINGTLYPVLTICDNSGQYFLKVDEIQRLNISNAEIAQAILSLPIQTTEMGADELIDASKHLITRTRILDQTQDNITRAITFLSLVEKAGVSCKDLFQLCQDYNGANISCCDAFAPVFTMNYGLCYAPNSSLLPQVHASGAFSELYIQLHMHKTWDISGSTKPSLALFFDTGVYQGLFKADVMVILPKYTLAVWVSVQRYSANE